MAQHALERGPSGLAGTREGIERGVTFEEATTVFADPLALIVEDAAYVDRALIIGESIMRRVLVTVFIEIDAEEIRIISARCATKLERRSYEEGEGA